MGCDYYEDKSIIIYYNYTKHNIELLIENKMIQTKEELENERIKELDKVLEKALSYAFFVNSEIIKTQFEVYKKEQLEKIIFPSFSGAYYDGEHIVFTYFSCRNKGYFYGDSDDECELPKDEERILYSDSNNINNLKQNRIPEMYYKDFKGVKIVKYKTHEERS